MLNVYCLFHIRSSGVKLDVDNAKERRQLHSLAVVFETKFNNAKNVHGSNISQNAPRWLNFRSLTRWNWITKCVSYVSMQSSMIQCVVLCTRICESATDLPIGGVFKNHNDGVMCLRIVYILWSCRGSFSNLRDLGVNQCPPVGASVKLNLNRSNFSNGDNCCPYSAMLIGRVWAGCKTTRRPTLFYLHKGCIFFMAVLLVSSSSAC